MTDPCSKKGMFICSPSLPIEIISDLPLTKWKYQPVDPPPLLIEISLKTSSPKWKYIATAPPNFNRLPTRDPPTPTFFFLE